MVFNDVKLVQHSDERIGLQGYANLDLFGQSRNTFLAFLLDASVLEKAKSIIDQTQETTLTKVLLVFNVSGHMCDMEFFK